MLQFGKIGVTLSLSNPDLIHEILVAKSAQLP